jgi:hypothetical protein
MIRIRIRIRFHIRIRIHLSETWIRGSRFGSTQKCHGSATLDSANHGRMNYKENFHIYAQLIMKKYKFQN